MPKNIFVSFDHDDANQVAGFKGIKNNPNHPLDFHDHSLKEAVKDREGRIIKYSPSDSRSEPVREIKSKLDNASKLVVLIGNNTYNSEWVNWEINTFYSMKMELDGEDTWRRIRGMKLKGSETASLPNSLIDKSVEPLPWDPEQLAKWIEKDL